MHNSKGSPPLLPSCLKSQGQARVPRVGIGAIALFLYTIKTASHCCEHQHVTTTIAQALPPIYPRTCAHYSMLMCLCYKAGACGNSRGRRLTFEGCEDRGQAHHFLHMQGQLRVEPIGVGPSSGGCAERCRARYPATPLQSARSAAARRFASHWVMMQVHRYKPSGNRAHSIARRRTERISTGLKCMLNPGAPQHVDLKRSLQHRESRAGCCAIQHACGGPQHGAHSAC
jgi:hypothetical protein